MTKPERKIVEKLLTCLDGQITQVPASKQELLDELERVFIEDCRKEMEVYDYAG